MSETENTKLVAVPYYGNLLMPPLGLTRVFFVATVDLGSKKVTRMELQVWDPKKEPTLSVWMRSQGFSGVICSDSGSHYRGALQTEGIWLIPDQEGEAAELVERWLAAALQETEKPGAKDQGLRLEKWWRRTDEPVLAV